ncbi:HDIG domain-containing metalloprotein [Porphyromonas macacae]|uniref:tRNA 2'-O-methylase n=1 Tax=Porphyromonas macacae TaxID=28115 RepID=A0A379DGQ1_9PORP|nr:HDIG domain-containing metalloprotein [Porphyromonas macacae]SUB77167.1 tRNA 2'-O-methylase [Porphyromonas macacae]
MNIDPIEIIKRFYSPSGLLYALLVKHSADVANLAVEVVRKHPELGADEQFVREAAMLHDIGVCRTDAPDIYCFGTEPYIRHGFLGAEMLREIGFPMHARVAERHTGTGLTPEVLAEKGIILPPGIYTPQSIEEKIVCFADKFFSKSNPDRMKSPDKIRKSMAKYGEESVKRWDDMYALFG